MEFPTIKEVITYYGRKFLQPIFGLLVRPSSELPISNNTKNIGNNQPHIIVNGTVDKFTLIINGSTHNIEDG